MKLTGGQIVARALKEYGVEYVAGVPGHGIWSLFDAFLEKGSEIPFIQVMHEQSAVHMADGYFRASGRPMACSTSIGPGNRTRRTVARAGRYAVPGAGAISRHADRARDRRRAGANRTAQ